MILRNLVTALFLLIAAVTLSACGGSVLDKDRAADGVFSQTGGQDQSQSGIGGSAASSAQRVFAANSPGAAGQEQPDYKMAPLDVIDVAVYGVPDLNRSVQISSSGMINLPLVRTVRAGGKTTSQLERDIASKLAANYLQAPQVTVFVKEFNSQKFTVDGAVKKPGIFPMTGRMSLLQSIALAEGLNDVADPTGILLFRTVGNKRMAARFDLKAIRGGKVNDPWLQAGDIVMVDQSAARSTWRDVKDSLPISGLFQLLLL
jgi:polysaccharide biosynthesis/export protein